MKILVTGANGFIGKNLIAQLKNQGYMEIFPYDIDTDPALLDQYCAACEFVFHLAGVNRPKEEAEFMEGNFGFSSVLLDTLRRYGNKAPILVTSSIQAELDNPYGRSKKAGEELVFNYGKETSALTYVYRLANVFGKWCRPNYNSVIATFCHNIANGLPITVNDASAELNLVYVDDVVGEFIRVLKEQPCATSYLSVEPVYHTTLGELALLIKSFKESREDLSVPDMNDPLAKKLYSTYLSYLPEKSFSYPLKMNTDDRGSFTEFIRTDGQGQFSVNISRPGITKGNHWHHTKNEKFLVVAGQGIIYFRKIDEQKVLEYPVSSEQLEVVDIPVGYTHSIKNTGDTDMVTLMWANECFDPENPDTYFLEV